MAPVRTPFQLPTIIRARWIQSPGAWRLPASLRTWCSSIVSRGGRARSNFGIVDSSQPAIVHLAAGGINPLLRNAALARVDLVPHAAQVGRQHDSPEHW